MFRYIKRFFTRFYKRAKSELTFKKLSLIFSIGSIISAIYTLIMQKIGAWEPARVLFVYGLIGAVVGIYLMRYVAYRVKDFLGKRPELFVEAEK